MPTYCVIQLARFGDLVQTKRLIRTLCARGETHLCVDKSLTDLAALLYPDVILHPVPVHGALEGAPFADLFTALRRLGSIPFDVVYNLNHSPLNRAVIRLFPADCVRGYAMLGPQPLRDAWIRLAFRWTRRRVMAPINLVDFWAYLDAKPCPGHIVNPPASGQGRGIGVVLAGRESRRSLPPTVLARCLQTVFEARGGPSVYFLGTAAERPLGRQLKRHLPGHMLDRIEDLSGKTTWRDLAEALTGLDAVLTPDTGTMHLAAHVGAPVQAFFLSSAWCHETGPYGEGHTVWQSAFPCAPCLESAPCTRATACLAPFGERGHLRALAASVQGAAPTPMPEHLLWIAAGTDALGGVWRVRAGQDTHAARRAALRCLVAEYLGVPLEPCADIGADVLQELTEMLYDESDWMLPDYARERGEVHDC